MSPRSRTATNNCPHCGNIDALDAIPPSPELIASNSPPSESETKTFLSARARARLRVDLLTEQIQGLIDEKDALKTKILEYDVVLHPIRNAPDDILTRVFLACLDESIHVSDRPISPDPRNVPWALSQVSSRWRSIALSFPRLWSCIVIKLGAPRIVNNPRKLVAFLTTQLQRSVAHPLVICLISDIPASHPLIPILLSTSSRWKQLSFMISLTNLRSFSAIGGCLHNLQTIYLFTENDKSPPTPLDMIHSSGEFPIHTMFQSTPQLRVVVGNEPASLLAFELPWSHIRHLESYSGSRLMELVRRASNTESITCHRRRQGIGGGGEALPSDSPVELPMMRTLALVDDPGWIRVELPQVLKHIRTPSLETLDFTCYDSFVGNSLLSLIEVSHPPITTLKIISYQFTSDDCLRLIGNIPTLRSLSLHATTCNSGFRDKLADTPSLAPLLELLEIGTVAEPTYSLLRLRMTWVPQVIPDILWEDLRASRPGLKILLGKTTGGQVV